MHRSLPTYHVDRSRPPLYTHGESCVLPPSFSVQTQRRISSKQLGPNTEKYDWMDRRNPRYQSGARTDGDGQVEETEVMQASSAVA